MLHPLELSCVSAWPRICSAGDLSTRAHTPVLRAVAPGGKSFSFHSDPALTFQRSCSFLSADGLCWLFAEGTNPSLMLFWSLLLLYTLPWDACIIFYSVLCRPLLIFKKEVQSQTPPKNSLKSVLRCDLVSYKFFNQNTSPPRPPPAIPPPQHHREHTSVMSLSAWGPAPSLLLPPGDLIISVL